MLRSRRQCQTYIHGRSHCNNLTANAKLRPGAAVAGIKGRYVATQVTLYLHPLRRRDPCLGCRAGAFARCPAALEGNALSRCDDHHRVCGIRLKRIANHYARLGPVVGRLHALELCYNRAGPGDLLVGKVELIGRTPDIRA